MRALDLLRRSCHAPQLLPVGLVQAKRDQLAVGEPRERDLIIPNTRRRMTMRYFHLPLHVLLRRKLHWRLSSADTKTSFTAKLRPVGFSEAGGGDEGKSES
jgi:hypothetical protein